MATKGKPAELHAERQTIGPDATEVDAVVVRARRAQAGFAAAAIRPCSTGPPRPLPGR